jgi:hypothetical protein
MSTRLTNELRDKIAADILRHRFTEQVDALIADRAVFADAIYTDIFRKSDREKMAALPKGWLPEETSIGAQFGEASGRYENVNFNGFFYGKLSGLRTTREGETVTRRVPYKHRTGCAKVYDDAHKLTQRHMELSDRLTTLTEEYSAAKRQTMAALHSASTIKRLVEAWPEVAPFTAKYENAPSQLPSVPVAKLNEMLGLPVAA